MKTLLVVDDDTDFLEELRTSLELFGYHVLSVSMPSEAIKLALKVKPACILFDLRMPGKHGLQFVEELKADPSLRRIPTIAMSAFYTREYDMLLSLFGIKRCFKKPFMPEDAVREIEAVLK